MIRHSNIRRRVITPAVGLAAPRPEVDVSEAATDSHKAIVETAYRIVILATDRHRCGQPVRALTECGRHLVDESVNYRFARFKSKEDAESWMDKNRLRLDSKTWRYTIIDP